MKTSEKHKIEALKKRVKFLEEDREKILQDRSKFRSHFARRMKWYIELLGESKTPNMQWLVEDESKFLNSVEHWYW